MPFRLQLTELKRKFRSEKCFYCANPKTVNTRIISGMLLCCEKKANQRQDRKTASCNAN